VVENGKLLARSIYHGGFTRANGAVLFLTSDGFTRPRLRRATLNDVKTEKLNVPFGKPFEINGEIYVPSAQMLAASEIRYGLYGRGMSLLEGTQDQFVYDVRGKHKLYADIPTSFVS